MQAGFVLRSFTRCKNILSLYKIRIKKPVYC